MPFFSAFLKMSETPKINIMEIKKMEAMVTQSCEVSAPPRFILKIKTENKVPVKIETVSMVKRFLSFMLTSIEN